MIRVYFNPDRFYEILHSSGTSASALCNPENKEYIGWTIRTITRSTKNGYMSKGLYDAIMNVIDISECVIRMEDSNNTGYFSRLKSLEQKVNELDEQLKLLKNEILHTL